MMDTATTNVGFYAFFMRCAAKMTAMNGTVLHTLITGLTKAVVDNPEHVQVTFTAAEHGFNFDIHVAESDFGKVIGKQGRTATSIRNIVGAAATKLKTTAYINIAALPLS